MKITFGIIVFNGDFFLKQVLESIKPFAHKICIAEGPVKYWQNKGFTTSTDDTNTIITNFGCENYGVRMQVVHEQWKEKDDQCRAWFKYVPDDTDYVICVDADEVHRPEDIEKLIKFLEKEEPTSVGFKSDSFYGGFDRVIGGFERNHSFKRVLKYEPGCYYRTHRQPTLAVVHDGMGSIDIAGKDITGNQLYEATGIIMPHYSYVSPKGVYEKIQYYEDAVISEGNCIPNYFKDVFVPWVKGSVRERSAIELKWRGVQEFMPKARGEAYTEPFTGKHPDIILRDMSELKAKFELQLKEYGAK